MGSVFEIGLWILSLVIGFILGWFTNWYFYKKQLKENESLTQTLKRIEQYNDAEIRLGKDKRGKIVKNPDGTIAIKWQVNYTDSLTVSDGVSIQTKKATHDKTKS